MRILHNKNGYSIIDSVVALFLIGMFTIVLHTFNSYAAASVRTAEKNMAFFEIIHNKTQQSYLEDWSKLTSETIDEDGMMVQVIYSDYEPYSEFHTQRIKITFIYKEIIKVYELEKEING